MLQQIKDPQQRLNEIFLNLKFIQTQSSTSYIGVSSIKQIKNQLLNYKIEQIQKQKILLFFGFQHEDVDGLYAHFQDKNAIVQDEYIKIVKLKKESKVSYLINTPYSLEGIQDIQLCLKQCVTRIILNKILLQFKDCSYHIIVNFEKLQGNTQQEQLNQITDYGLFNYGELEFKNVQVSLILNIKNNQEISYALVKDIKKCVVYIQHILKQQALRLIFSKNQDIFYKIQNVQELYYGPMSLFLSEKMENYVVQITTILRSYQDQLLYLQQIPNLQDEQDLNNCLISLIEKLNNIFLKQSNQSLESIYALFKAINNQNQQHLEQINQYLKQINIKIIESFLQDKRISFENLLIPTLIAKPSEIEFINNMFKKYIPKEFTSTNVNEIKNLILNVKCWNSYSTLMVESIIQNFKQITQHIQEGPENEREVGVFLFGKSRVGKSTLINLLKNPESLTIEKKISELCYVSKDETQFKIEHGCMSETQKISDMQIGDIWFYDCPGFDDNISQQIRIAHRISLYNHLVKTKKVLGFFMIDSSNKDAQIIKDTFDPIYLLLQDKKQLTKENNKWASLVLVKTKQNTRKDYIENWEEAYHGLLEGKYTFYREMYQNNNQCIEFPKPKKNLQSEQILEQNTQIQKKILQIINENKQNQDFQLKLNLQIDSKLFYLYEIVLSMLQIKIEQIVALLKNQIDTYILEDEDKLENKQQLIQQFQYNVKEILGKILEWCQLNRRFKNNSLFLQRAIDDVLKCLEIDRYCKNRKISAIKVDTSILENNAKKIINLIQNISKLEFGLKTGFIILSIGGAVASCGAAIVAEGLGTAAIEVLVSQVARKVAIRAAITGVGGTLTSTLTFIIFYFRQQMLKSRYESYLKEQEQKANN
ncbi:unnamed protein product [Paramecium pentaurelia]|uniref:G domain-containing protein n=1 Tax=Paramecium pentaurelia TaxID=43138 RepID=A0A8S1WCY8_9CILI|nr:unnamed protein product [Paramecium pentaurelia]